MRFDSISRLRQEWVSNKLFNNKLIQQILKSAKKQTKLKLIINFPLHGYKFCMFQFILH
jgi:hypothetical protein